MKKALKVIAGVALAGCMLLPLAACSDTNNSEEVKQLQQQIQDLQTEIDSLKNGNGGNDLFTGSPKFNYGINETIPYYINGTKIFDFKITSFIYDPSFSYRLTWAYYTVTFSAPTLNTTTPSNVFSAVVYKPSDNTYPSIEGFTDTALRFNDYSGKELNITLFYLGSPFATITGAPTQRS